jgi:hypothetical protein
LQEFYYGECCCIAAALLHTGHPDREDFSIDEIEERPAFSP